tara:strand:- start:1732 stop:2631 length:900 start_codon:yes stop_codon:yes gene_type:complete
MKLKQLKDYYNTDTVEFVIKENYELVEDREFVPRFSLKNVKEISNIPVNEPIKYSDKIMTTAIKYGMVMLINYKGEKDSHFSGHERVIYPLVLGRSSKGKILLRGWHLNGWSVSNKRHVNKIWRLFRTDRILSITFTGSFYRLAPAGYKMNDKGMRGGIIAKADFIRIRKNQQDLINQNKIQNRDEITMGDDKRKFVTVDVTNTETELDLTKPLDNTYIKSIKDFRTTRISFLKSISGKEYIAILGALGQPGNTVKVMINNKSLGVFKVMDSITGNVLKSIKRVKGNSVYDLYVFDKKR